jgi:hypothetical protein
MARIAANVVKASKPQTVTKVRLRPTAKARFTRRDDGLAQRWFGRVWLNPPYSSNVIGRWLARLAEHGTGTALIFARTETEMFFRSVWVRASGCLFLRGRLNFHYPDGRRAKANSGAPSVLCAYGRDDLDCLAGCGLDGKLVPLLAPRAMLLVETPAQTWREIVREWFGESRDAVPLDTLYRALAAHPKAQGKAHYREKIRQVLQQGPFERVGPGLWAAA